MAAIFGHYLFSRKFLMTPANTLHNARVADCESKNFCLLNSIYIVHKCPYKARARGKGYGGIYKKMANKSLSFADSIVRHISSSNGEINEYY